MSTEPTGVSFVIPVHNGERWIRDVLTSVFAQADGRPFQVLVVDDGSTDGSARILEEYASEGRLELVQGQQRGAAAAANLGISKASHPIVCQVDQDVILQRRWMASLLAELEGEGVAAAQGYYITDPTDSLWARVMGRDLEFRYSQIRGRHMDHVCTGNTAYRADLLREVGLFDESFGYGYDNDMSYRLGEAGYRLAFCRKARSIHRWRARLTGYLTQQYGVGYGRLDLICKHRGRRIKGDDVSGLRMILHVPLMLAALVALAAAGALALADLGWLASALTGAGLLGLLAADRLAAGLEAWARFDDVACLAFVPAHLLRDLVWVAALAVWCLRRVARRPGHARDSMFRP